MSRSNPSAPASDGDRQEEALKDTFPASDPVPASGNKVDRGPAHPRSVEDEVQADLDESLKETFPASDPPALSDPDHEFEVD